MRLILASTSSVRKKILTENHLNFEVIAPLYDEDSEKLKLPKMLPQQLAIFLAKQKALSVSKAHPSSYVIGSDQVCEIRGKEISKSKNREEAIAQLSIFSGRVHHQNNAVAVACGGKIIFENFSRVELKMRKLSNSEIESYVDLDRPWGCAGSYKYESLGKHLFERIDGDYFSVLGLSIQPLISFLYKRKLVTFSDLSSKITNNFPLVPSKGEL